jgi:Zn-dependent M28 family amino/carboxypeptidase
MRAPKVSACLVFDQANAGPRHAYARAGAGCMITSRAKASAAEPDRYPSMTRTLVLLCALAAACTPPPLQRATLQQGDDAESGRPVAASEAAVAELAEAASSITPADFFARIGFLASDALGGRDTPSPGLEAAAAYIASEFQRFGLRPGGDSGSFLQRWPYTTRALDVAALRFDATARGVRRAYSPRTDFYAQPGLRGSFSGGLVFTGPAVVRAEALRGRAPIIAPAAALTPLDVRRARALADSAGAGALVVVLPADVNAEAIANAPPASSTGSIPAFFLRRDRAAELFRDAGLDAVALSRAAVPARPLVLPRATVAANASVVETVHRVPNVAGVVEGSDPKLKHTYVVVSAHIDHVGSGCRGTSPQDDVCNGADDDASGTSAIIELAEAFALLPVKPKRSLMFLGVSGEEKGLLGSSYFADNPTVPIDSIVANVNIDMIGRNDPDSVIAIGQKYSSLGRLLHTVNQLHPELRMTVSDDLWPRQNFFFRSDHFNFARREVPAIFFFTGTHEDYHAASDHVEKIDLDKITRIARLIFYYANEIANDVRRPEWDPAGLEEVRRLVADRRG